MFTPPSAEVARVRGAETSVRSPAMVSCFWALIKVEGYPLAIIKSSDDTPYNAAMSVAFSARVYKRISSRMALRPFLSCSQRERAM